MPRVKAFDQHEALDKITQLFWEKGYYDTSIDDIVTCSGVSRSGLYNTWGDKKALFLHALEHYRCTIIEPMLAEIKAEDAGLQAIFNLFEMMRAMIHSGEAKFGCFVCNTSVELASHDIDISSKITSLTDMKRTTFRRALTNAKERGEIPDTINIDAMTDHLTASTMGIGVLCKSALASSMIDNVIDTTLAPLKAIPKSAA